MLLIQAVNLFDQSPLRNRHIPTRIRQSAPILLLIRLDIRTLRRKQQVDLFERPAQRLREEEIRERQAGEVEAAEHDQGLPPQRAEHARDHQRRCPAPDRPAEDAVAVSPRTHLLRPDLGRVQERDHEHRLREEESVDEHHRGSRGAIRACILWVLLAEA